MAATDSQVLNVADFNRHNIGQKREFKLSRWKNIVSKKNKATNDPYKGRNGKFHPGVLPPQLVKICTRCDKSGCSIQIPDKLKLYQRFRSLDYNGQNAILASCIKVTEPKERTTLGRTKLNTYKYSINCNGRNLEICKKSLLSLFTISKKRSEVVTEKLKTGDISPRDKRGTHNNRPNRVSLQVRQEIRDHILSFPTYESHYTRNQTPNPKQYLNPELSVSTMYDLFIQSQRNNNRDEAEEWLDRDIFKKQFQLKIGDPKLDTCDNCDKFNTQNRASDDEWNLHKDVSSARYQSYKTDNDHSKLDPSYVVLTCDIRQVIFTPNLKNSASFYLRKMSNYNFCVNRSSDNSATMHLWNETIGKRGSNEVASCLWSYLKTEYPVLNQGESRVLVLWADRCTGQNNNNIILSLLVRLVRLNYFTEVHQKFFTTGHSYNDCDRCFGHIEKILRQSTVLTPSDIENLISSSSANGKFQVKRMLRHKFLDFKSNWKFLNTPQTLQVTKYLWFSYSLPQANYILTRITNADGVWICHSLIPLGLFDMCTNRCAYPQRLTMTAAKLADIKKLVEFLAQGPQNYYKTLLNI